MQIFVLHGLSAVPDRDPGTAPLLGGTDNQNWSHPEFPQISKETTARRAGKEPVERDVKQLH